MGISTTALLAGSLAASAGGMALSYDAQRDAQRDRNRQIDANNRRLEDQYAQRQAQENAARAQIERLADRGYVDALVMFRSLVEPEA